MTIQIDIRDLYHQAEFDACEDIQIAAWQMGERDVVPAHLLKVIASHGGIVLGAFTPDERLVGFVFSMVSRVHTMRRHVLVEGDHAQHSDMMGIHPDFQNQSIGKRLKWAQREAALLRGYRLITWTYDPMLGPNANLNITHLGVTCRHYIRDAYGELDGIYEGLNTDRFEIEWWLDSPRVRMLSDPDYEPHDLSWVAWRKAGAVVVNARTISDDGLPIPGEIDIPKAGPVMVEVPGDFNAVRVGDMGLAKAWRQHGREVFEALFENDYVVQRFVRHEGLNYYVLWQDKDE